MLSNLLSNALKFTAAGKITIDVDSIPPYSSSHGDEIMLRISVSDTGIGMASEVQENLFSAFMQANSSVSRVYGGTGLGLSISKQLANLMGGEIGLESVKGLGSKFWFTIACSVATQPVDQWKNTALEESWQSNRSLKILVAEDTVVIQQLITVVLEELGHVVTMTKDGKECLECHEAGDFDIILMDVRMPGMGGMEATGIIRKMPGSKSDIPIIAVTADVTAGNISEYFDSGVNDVCTKPIELAVLLRSIDNLLGEEIHTSRPTPRAIAKNTELTEPAAPPTSEADLTFDQILDRVSAMIDQQPSPAITAPASKSAASSEKWLKLVASFECELLEDSIALRKIFDDLSLNPDNDEIRHDISTKTHSLKGVGGGYGYDLVTTVAREVDDLLKAETLNKQVMSTIGHYLDALSLIAEKRISGDGGNAGRILLEALRNDGHAQTVQGLDRL